MNTMPETIRPFSDQLQKALADACASCADDHKAGIGLAEDGSEISVFHGVANDASSYDVMRVMVRPRGVQSDEYARVVRLWIQGRHREAVDPRT